MTSYAQYPRFHVSVDCAIFSFREGRLEILIHRRPYSPAQGQQSLIGGFVERDENLEQAAARILYEFTGLERVYMQQLAAFGDVGRDPVERVISVVYYALINIENYKESSVRNQTEAHWVDVDSLPRLCLDHNDMVAKARRMIGEEIKASPSVSSNLLPRYFTLTLLQTLYESILGQPVDKRNFRRSVADKRCVHATKLIDKGSSRRGATLYEFS